MKIKAVSLFSGGLDSSIAVALIRDQGVEVTAFHLVSSFCQSDFYGNVHEDIVAAAEELGVELHTENSTQDMIELVRSPKHGFGKNLNPCIDCRMNILRRAEEYRKTIGAHFLISGEVLGQRPMSQNRPAMSIIDKECGVDPDIIVRPLCAGLFEPSLPEREGWIDRSKLLSIHGRGRTVQLELAKKIGINKFGAPAGGCHLTDRKFCNRLRALIKMKPDYDKDDVRLLRTGRHFQGFGNSLIVCGRDHEENLKLFELAKEGDILLQAVPTRGSVCLVRTYGEKFLQPAPNSPISEQLTDAAGLAIHYSRNRETGSSDIELRTSAMPEEQEGIILKGAKVIAPQELINVSD